MTVSMLMSQSDDKNQDVVIANEDSNIMIIGLA